VADLLNNHEFDETADARLRTLIANREYLAQPLIVTEGDTTDSVFIIDGWHRLALMYKITLLQKDPSVVKFMAYHVSKADCELFKVDTTHGNLRNVDREEI
jgi:cytochrome c oxidase subunit IV